MINRILFIGVATLLLASCGPKEFSPCECQKAISGENNPAESIKWCNDKIAKDKTFADAVAVCTAEALGHDTSKSNVSNTTPLRAENGTYNVVSRKSSIKWTGRKPASSHTGEVGVKSGEFTLDAQGNITAGTVIIDMNDLTVSDIKDAESNADLVGHLKADDFFGVDKHKQAIYQITKASLIEGGNGTNYNVEGELTIKGVTKPVNSILVIVKSKAIPGNVSVAGGITFDRTEFGIEYNSGKFFESLGDKLIKDEVSLQVTLVAKKK
ncbi:MAG: YceI family protein [Flavobacteriales bacterium]